MKTIMIPEGKERRMYQASSRYESLLQASNEKYKVIRTRTTVKIIPENEEREGRFYLVKGLSPQELHFIKKTKNHFRTLKRPIRQRPYGTSTYYNLQNRNLIAGEYLDYCEIDVSGAYWEQANLLGYLSKELYEQGKDTSLIRKKVRLMALGSLAKRIETLYYEPGNYGYPEIDIQEDELEVFWDNITYYFGLEMFGAWQTFTNSMLGYWVDAVFVRNYVAPQVKQYFKSKGFDVTLEPLTKVEVIPVGDELQIIRHFKSGEVKELPPFNPRMEKISNLKSARERFLGGLRRFMKSNNR